VFAGSAALASIESTTGSQVISTSGGMRVLGGGGVNGDAIIQAQTGQDIDALFIDVIGATGSAIIDTNGGLQEIDTSGKNTAAGASVGVNEGILVEATGSGVTAIHSDGTQDISVVGSDLVRVVGTVGDADITSAGTQSISITGSGSNAFEIGAVGAAGNSIVGGNQTITADSLVVQAGSGNDADAKLDSMGDMVLTITNDVDFLGGSGDGADVQWNAVGDLSADIDGNAQFIAGSGNNADFDLTAGSILLFDVAGSMTLQGGTDTSADVDFTSIQCSIHT